MASPYELFAPNFNNRFEAMPATDTYDPSDPTYAGIEAESRAQAVKNLATLLPEGRPSISGPTRPASQQPTIPIQTAQGAPQSPTQTLGNAPNSGMIGATPYSNQALTGGGGMPIGGLPTQSPTADYSSPQQVNPQQMQQPPITGPASPQFRMQQQQMNMQKFAQLLGKLRAYNFLGQS